MREKLTVNNLKTIVAKELKISREYMKIKLANTEVTEHKRLIDLGLVDGDILEAMTSNQEEQITIAMDKRVVRPGVEQHYAYQRQTTRKDY